MRCAIANSSPRRRPDGPAGPGAGARAIVVGASMAGLLAARVLADFYDEVLVLDRDVLPEGLSGARRAVPQGRHAHALQPAGQQTLERLFPGLIDEALQAGGAPYRPGVDWRFRAGGHLLARAALGGAAAVTSRPLLEGLVRRRVRALANVGLRERWEVLGLEAEGGRVTGVRARSRGDLGDPAVLRADLVVAASGRGSRLAGWLRALGYEAPAEERVAVDIHYASRHVRLPAGALRDAKAVIDGPRPGRPRGIAMIIEEGDRWNVTLYGYGREQRPPTDDAGFLAFAATVAEPDVAAALEQAQPLDEIATHAFPASLRRRYDRLRRFPEGLVVTGDASCSFNPIYGQGMTVAALEAAALERCLLEGDHRLARRFFKAAAGPIGDAWKLATGADLALPEVEGRAPLPDRVVNRYLERLLTVAEDDQDVSRAFVEVLSMLRRPAHLMTPAIATRVLRGSTRAAAVRQPPATAGRIVSSAPSGSSV